MKSNETVSTVGRSQAARKAAATREQKAHSALLRRIEELGSDHVHADARSDWAQQVADHLEETGSVPADALWEDEVVAALEALHIPTATEEGD